MNARFTSKLCTYMHNYEDLPFGTGKGRYISNNKILANKCTGIIDASAQGGISVVILVNLNTLNIRK